MSGTSQCEFSRTLYEEGLEAASFLYGQRLELLDTPGVGWKTLGQWEARFEAQTDALLVGGEPALEVCRVRGKDADPGELHTAVRLFCRQRRTDLLAEVLGELDLQNAESRQGVALALRDDLPAEWQDDFPTLLESDGRDLCALVAEVAGYRRLDAGPLLVRALRRWLLPSLIWAAGRLRERRARNLLLGALLNPQDAIASAAALSLLRMGERQAMTFCEEMAGEKEWAVIPLALAGGRQTGALLLEMAQSGESISDLLLALGLIGEASAMPLLLSKLEGDLAASAALALNLLTGAGLYERVFVPEEVDEDELFPEELASYRKDGKVPTKADGSPFGAWVTRLSQKPQEWRQWWDDNGQDFRPGVRYRNGRPCHPAELLATLQHEKTPRRIRQLAYEELVIRYDADFPFEADLPVTDQLLVLEGMAAWINDNGGRFMRGEWYFGGEIIPDRLLKGRHGGGATTS